MHIHCTAGDYWKHCYTMHAHVHSGSCTKEIQDIKVTLGEAHLFYRGYEKCPLIYTHLDSILNYDRVQLAMITKPCVSDSVCDRK